MKLFGIYKGKIYILIDDSIAQGYSTYREYTLDSSYSQDGTFAFSLNSMNIDVNIRMSNIYYEHTPNHFKGLQSIVIAPNGNIIPHARFGSTTDANGNDIIRYSHGYVQTARNQWYGESSVDVNPFVAMLKYKNPPAVDIEFLENVHYLQDLHEYVKLYSIDAAQFLHDLDKVADELMSVEDAVKNWSCSEINRRVQVKQLTIDDLRPFNVAEVVYWDSLQDTDKGKVDMEQIDAVPKTKPSKVNLKLVASN